MRVICRVAVRGINRVRGDFRAVLRICEPTQELCIFAFRFGGERELFSVDLLCRFRAAVAQIPRHDVGICGKLRVKRLAGSHGADRGVELAIRFCGVPAFEAVTFFDRERRGSCRFAVRLDGFAIRCFAVNGAAVAACIPCDGQGNGCATIVALAVTVRIGVVGVFFTGRFTDGAGLRALVLCFVCCRPLAVSKSMVSVLIVAGGTGRAASRAPMLCIAVIAPAAILEAVVGVGVTGISAKTARRSTAMLRIRIGFPTPIF